MQHKSGKRGGRGRVSFGGGEGPKSKKGYLHEDTMSYYRRISDSLKQFESEEQQIDPNFLNTTFSNLAEEVVQVSQNQTVSIIIESLVAAASPSNLRTLYVAVVQDLSVAFLDRFASHVFERLVQKLPHFYHQPAHESADDEEEDVAQDKLEESFQTMRQFVDSQFETLVTHMYGSHVLRALLEALSGVPVVHELKKGQKSGHSRHSKEAPAPQRAVKLPEGFKTQFHTYAEKLFRFCDYEVHLKDPFFSLLLQAVLMIWHKADDGQCQTHCQNIVQRVEEFCPQSDSPAECIPDVAQDAVGSHLLEVIFKVSSAQLLQRVFESLLQGKLLYYAIHPVANYVLQRFISSLRDKDVMEKLFDELSKHLEDVLAVGHLGLVTCLATACRHLRLKQDDFITSLMGAFHCQEPPERQPSLIKLIASLTAYEVFFALGEGEDKPAEGSEASLKGPINIHGSLLLQQLLQFQKPKHAALGIAALEPEELKVLCCDPSGSHVVDVFFSSSSVLEKNKDIFLRKMKGLLVEVACTRNGSRCLEGVWKHLNVKQRTRLAEELAANDRLRGDRFGHFLVASFGLLLLSSRRESWLERQGADTKRKRMMKELLHSIGPPGKKKKDADQDVGLLQHEKEEDLDCVTAMFLKQKKATESQQRATAQPQEDNDAKKRSAKDSSAASASPGESAEDGDSSPRKKKKRKKDKEKAVKQLSKQQATDSDGDEDGDVSRKRQPDSEEGKSRKKEKRRKKSKKVRANEGE